MNGDFTVNIKVHYFDKTGTEREAIIPTGFTKGSGEYPIGATIDIIALGTNYTWDKDSVNHAVQVSPPQKDMSINAHIAADQ